MEDSVKVLTTKFQLSAGLLEATAKENDEVSAWLVVLSAYVLDHDKRVEEQTFNEAELRKQRLNAEHQLNQLEKQLISCNAKLSTSTKDLLATRTRFEEASARAIDFESKHKQARAEADAVRNEERANGDLARRLENEKIELAALLEKKNRDLERMNIEWTQMSEKFNESHKSMLEKKYQLQEIQNHDITREFKEKRLEQEKQMLLQQLGELNKDLKEKSECLNSAQKSSTTDLRQLQAKLEAKDVENIHLTQSHATYKKMCEEQEKKLSVLAEKVRRLTDEHAEVESQMQQELSAKTRLAQLYLEDRDDCKRKLQENTSAIEELRTLLQRGLSEKEELSAELQILQQQRETSEKENRELNGSLTIELKNANELLNLSRQKGNTAIPAEALESLSPMAAATSSILKRGMTLTQIYTEYVKVTDSLQAEKDENDRLKCYLKQILEEVEEKAPLLQQQKQDYNHALRTIESMSRNLDTAITENHQMKNEQMERDRKVDFHKREEKRLHQLCVDLSKQVRFLMKEVEESRGGSVVSSTTDLPELLPESTSTGAGVEGEGNVSNSAQVISEHLVTFKSIEELQSQNQRLLAVVRELSEEQEKLEKEGGPDVIQELKRKIESAQEDMNLMKDSQQKQEEMMEQLARQRDMYKVLCQQGGGYVDDSTVGGTAASAASGQSILEVETDLLKARAVLDTTVTELDAVKKTSAEKEESGRSTITKLEEELTTVKLERDRVKNQLEFAEEKHSIISATSEGFKKEAKALEGKCASLTAAHSKLQVEADTYRSDYASLREKLLTAEVQVKSLETEKHLIKEGEKRLMQENQSMLAQQRSQNVLLTGLQTSQNKLESQLFDNRRQMTSENEKIQLEMKGMRKRHDAEDAQMRQSSVSMRTELATTKEELTSASAELETLRKAAEETRARRDELDVKLTETSEKLAASEKRLEAVLEREASGREKEDYQHETERYKEKIRSLEIAIGKAHADVKTTRDASQVAQKHVAQYKDMASANDDALVELRKSNKNLQEASTKTTKKKDEEIRELSSKLTATVTDKNNLSRRAADTESSLRKEIGELRTAAAPMEKRLQEMSRALVQAKELETSALSESKDQSHIATSSQEKYERELILHAKDVQQMTLAKDELQAKTQRLTVVDEKLREFTLKLTNNDRLMEQMRSHHSQEIRKNEVSRKDLIDQNGILHKQVEKLSATIAEQKAAAASEAPEVIATSTDASIEEVYELLRFVRREKEIAETKFEASETESMRYRQRAEHLQRDIDETKAALELELQRTQGRMLTEEEFKEATEKSKRCKELEVLNKEVEKQKNASATQNKALSEKSKRLESSLKKAEDEKKSIEAEKSSWLAEKTALKTEIERWTARTNQLMANETKAESEEVKKLTTMKTQLEKSVGTLRDEASKNKLQLDAIKRESLKLKQETTALHAKVSAKESELLAARKEVVAEKQRATAATAAATAATAAVVVPATQPTDFVRELVVSEAPQKQLEALEKELDEMKQKVDEKEKVNAQLRRIARKHKDAHETLQATVQKDKSATVATGDSEVTTDPSATSTSEESKEMATKLTTTNNQLEEARRELEQVSARLSEVNARMSEKENELAQSKLESAGCEEMKQRIDELEKEGETNKVQQAAKDRLLRSAKQMKKQKDSLQLEVEALRHASEEARRLVGEAETEATQLRSQLETHASQSDQLIKQLTEEKRQLLEQIDSLKQKKSSWPPTQPSHSAIQPTQPQESSSSSAEAPLTATVRPTSASAASQQASSRHHHPTASIRPLAHTTSAPTAMVVPNLQPPQAATAALPQQVVPPQPQVTPQGTPQVSGTVEVVPTLEVAVAAPRAIRRTHSRPSTSRTQAVAPVVMETDHPLEDEQPIATEEVRSGEDTRPTVHVQPEQVSPSSLASTSTSTPTTGGSTSGTTGVTTSSTSASMLGKRTHTVAIADELDDEEASENALLADDESARSAPENKRVRIVMATSTTGGESSVVEADSQQTDEVDDDEGIDDLLADDDAVMEGEDDVIEMPADDEQPTRDQVVSSPPQVLEAASSTAFPLSQASALENMQRQQRQPIVRSRAQLPSFSLMPGQSTSGFDDPSDADCMVPSTPTLAVVNRSDGFAEAVHSPLVRNPAAFSFLTTDQSNASMQSRDVSSSNQLVLPTSDAAASPVPLTPMSIVPVVMPTSFIQSEAGDPDEENAFSLVDHVSQSEEQNVPQQIDLTEDDEDEYEEEYGQDFEVLAPDEAHQEDEDEYANDSDSESDAEISEDSSEHSDSSEDEQEQAGEPGELVMLEEMDDEEAEALADTSEQLREQLREREHPISTSTVVQVGSSSDYTTAAVAVVQAEERDGEEAIAGTSRHELDSKVVEDEAEEESVKSATSTSAVVVASHPSPAKQAPTRPVRIVRAKPPASDKS